MRGLFFSIVFAYQFLISSAFAQTNQHWIALEVDGEIMTSFEVTDYINSVVIAADIHSQIFTEAHKDYAEYMNKKQSLIDELYPRVLKQLSSIRLIQSEATKGDEYRHFFKLTKTEFKKAYDDKVDKVLTRYAQASGRLEDAQNAFAEDLVKNGYPIYEGQNLADIYQEWSRQLKLRIKEEYRWKEATRFLCALGDCTSLGENVVFQKNRKIFEKSHFLAMRPTPNERMVGKPAYDFLFKEDFVPNEENEVKDPNKLEKEFYLGKFNDDRLEIIHMNDWNLLGPVGSKLGYPDTDDFGRTAGTLIRYIQNREKGSWSVEFENWLFAEKIGERDGQAEQHIEDETTLRIVSRHFLDGEGNKWVLIGVSATHRIQEAGLGAWLQKSFHKISGNSGERINVPRDEVETFINGLIGVGGKYSIIDSAHVDLIIRGEIVLAPAAGKWSESYVQVSSGVDLNVYGKNKRLPILQVGLFGDIKLHADGEVETTIGGKVTISVLIKRLYIQSGLFVARYDSAQDRRYEGGASWTTGILITISVQPKRKIPDYVFSPVSA